MINLHTRNGMRQAVSWLEHHLAQIKEGGVWGIPRTVCAYQVWHSRHELKLLCGDGDAPTERVAKEAGWTVVKLKEK